MGEKELLRKQANLRYDTWERLMKIRLNLRLTEISDVIDTLYEFAIKINPEIKIKESLNKK